MSLAGPAPTMRTSTWSSLAGEVVVVMRFGLQVGLSDEKRKSDFLEAYHILFCSFMVFYLYPRPSRGILQVPQKLHMKGTKTLRNRLASFRSPKGYSPKVLACRACAFGVWFGSQSWRAVNRKTSKAFQFRYVSDPS